MTRSHTHSIAIKHGTYLQLLGLSTNLQDSFDNVIQRLLAEHKGHKNREEPGSGLVPLDQVRANTTIEMDGKLGK